VLSKWIFQSYRTLLEFVLWLFLGIGGLIGVSIGAAADHPFMGLLVGAATAFLGMVAFIGAALTLHEIQRNVSSIETSVRDLQRQQTEHLKVQEKEKPGSGLIECVACGKTYRPKSRGTLCECGMTLR